MPKDREYKAPKDLTCPYCKYEQNASDIHDPDVTHEVECDACGQIFGVITEYWPSYTEKIMPCANGDPHNFMKRVRHPRVIGGKEEYYCEWCDTTEDRPAECLIGCTRDKKECFLCPVPYDNEKEEKEDENKEQSSPD